MPAAPAVPAPRIGIRTAAWVDGLLELVGHAHAPGRSADRLGTARTLITLHRPDQRRLTVLRTTPRYLPEITDDLAEPGLNLDWAGFTVRIDPALLRRGGRWEDGVWRIGGLLLAGLRLQPGGFAAHWCGSGEYPPAAWVAEGVQAIPYFQDDQLHLRVETARARVSATRAVGDGVELACLSSRGPEGATVRLAHRQSGAVIALPALPGPALPGGGRTLTVRIPLGAFEQSGRPTPGQDDTTHWDPVLHYADGRSEPLVLDHRSGDCATQFALPAEGRTLRLKHLADSHLQLCEQPSVPVVDTLAPAADGFLLTGHFPQRDDTSYELVLRHGGGCGEQLLPVEPLTGNRFRVRVPVTAPTSYGTRLPLRKGVWDALIRPSGDAAHEQRVVLGPDVLRALPLLAEAQGKRILLQRRWHDTLILDSTPVLPAAERSAHRQLHLRTRRYPAARQRPLRDTVLYDVFGGRGYADSPRAIHAELARREPGLRHLWAVDDAQAALPDGVEAVTVWSPEWYEALATSRYLVGNTHFPEFVERRDGQLVVQTWHGTPLKRIAHDVETGWLADDGYLDRLAREAPQWSLLLSPNSFSTPIMRRAFRYTGEILESGYPRNDLLARPDPRLAATVRRRLGIPEGRRVVLYAPTWREDARLGDGYRLDLRLDPGAARRALGDDHVLLVRPHSHVLQRLPVSGDGFLYDVGDYPDTAELLLIADVLVTDYSSVMFDFANTGRPILFFTHDLTHYRDDLRGFYLDFEAEAPGPLLATSAELVAALGRVDAVAAEHADRYAAFRRRFCHLDDGSAAARVVDRMLAL
ncbi:CDP-glycerol glycerophosphotransferase family protein [Kitasatospora sp. GP82]|uniref:CDP-glycerol glycerophosphotransferase family protein n=1 Tax=Kitasatospora sp. GP82 TaxID=3035089 RepID=UPI002473BBC3|nr:CDP-glycerol glycerophosphotransferase family protein [Kitasatospora sp. GP82]MDH6124185.1 CDP-glycerol glycerophosphotransferase [Kitasatospora sp. GP82]